MFFCPATQMDDSKASLVYTLWEAVGLNAANVVLANDSDGNLVITASALTQRTYVRQIANPALADGAVRAIMLIEGWDTTTTQYVAGPGIRMSGINANNGSMNGYACTIQREGTLSGDPFRWRMRECTAGSNISIGTTSANVTGGLVGVWSDMRISALTAGANVDVACDCRREGQGASEYTDTVSGDTTPRSGTDFGIWLNALTTAQTIRVKRLEVL